LEGVVVSAGGLHRPSFEDVQEQQLEETVMLPVDLRLREEQETTTIALKGFFFRCGRQQRRLKTRVQNGPRRLEIFS
jgi:hypothetical protein